MIVPGKTVLGLGTLAALMISTISFAAPAPAFAAGTSYFVDCSASANGSGSSSSPWNSLAYVNNHAGGFAAGDSILLKAGTTCDGSISPSGSGTSGNPITIGSYGSGASPIIDALYSSAYVLALTDQSYWTVQNLELEHGKRFGVHVAVDSGTVNGISLTHLAVHDVSGGTLDSKETGLVVIATISDSTNSTNAKFNGVTINEVTAYNTTMWSGILVGSGNNTTDNWAPNSSKRSQNVTIENSTVYNVYGDGIVTFAANASLVQHNVAHDTGIQPTQTIGTPNAIWTWACDGCVVQYNEAYSNHSPGVDGGAFDIDYYSANTTVQYNYGHDNSAYCVAVFGANSFVTSNSIIRYNLCTNNGASSKSQPQDVVLATWNSGSIDGLRIYNNTFVNAHGVLNDSATFSGIQDRAFKNNLTYSSNPNPFGGSTSITNRSNNLWYSTAGDWSNSDASSVFADPNLVNVGHTGAGNPGNAFALKSTSPAIDAGTVISASGSADNAGDPTPQGNGPDIGAFESSYSFGRISNPAFELGSLSGWSVGSSSTGVVTSPVNSGSFAAYATGANTGIYRVITGLTPNTTYTFSGYIDAPSGQQAYLYAKSYGGADVLSSTATGTSGYVKESLTFTTGASNTSAEIGLWRDSTFGSGTVYLDDTSLC